MARVSRLGPGLVISLAAGGVSVHGQTISGVSASSVGRSDRLVISGTGFGTQQGGSEVRIGGAPAIVTFWSDSKIRAHVSPAAALGPGLVQVIAGAPSNELPLTITPPAPGAGRVRWRRRTDHYYSMSRPAVAPDGTVYITGVAGPLYSFSPSGDVRWVIQSAGGVRPPAVGADGTVYMSGAGGTITAATPAGQILWSYLAPPNAGPMFVGPDVGPDGKIYAVTEEEPILGTDFGAFALNPDGTLAWSRSGGYNFRYSPLGWEIVFSAGRLFFVTGQGGPLTGNPGVHALDAASGQELWVEPGTSKLQTDAAGSLYWLGAINNNYIGSYTPAGQERWTVVYNTFWGQPGGYAVAPDGASFYGTSTGARIAAINADGSIRWHHNPGYQVTPYGATPDSRGFVAGAYLHSPTSPRIRHYSGDDGSILWEEPLPFEDNAWVVPSWEGAFSPDGDTFYIVCHGNNYVDDPYSYLYAFDVSDGGACYADCSLDGALTVADFGCFQTRFVAGDPYADCNADGVMTAADFGCFQTRFVGGCP